MRRGRRQDAGEGQRVRTSASAVAKDKNRSASEGVLLGILLGFIGILIEVCLPRKQAR